MIPYFPPPSIDHFDLEPLDQGCLEETHSRIAFSLSLEHQHISQRLFFALLDDSREHGVAISVHPATGEVCDVMNGGGVIGYLSNSPLTPKQSVDCEIVLYKFGANCVCNARVDGETFLYPAFTMFNSHRLNGIVGVERDNARGGIVHSNVHLDVALAELPQAVA